MKKILVCLALVAAGGLMIATSDKTPTFRPAQKNAEACPMTDRDVKNFYESFNLGGHLKGQELVDKRASALEIECRLQRRQQAQGAIFSLVDGRWMVRKFVNGVWVDEFVDAQ